MSRFMSCDWDVASAWFAKKNVVQAPPTIKQEVAIRGNASWLIGSRVGEKADARLEEFMIVEQLVLRAEDLIENWLCAFGCAKCEVSLPEMKPVVVCFCRPVVDTCAFSQPVRAQVSLH